MSTLLEITVQRWAAVMEENERDKDLVSADVVESWEGFKVKTTEQLRTIIENYDGAELSETDSDWLTNLTRTIDSSKQVSREDLEAQKLEREAAEAQRLEEEEQKRLAEERRSAKVQNTKANLLGMLGK